MTTTASTMHTALREIAPEVGYLPNHYIITFGRKSIKYACEGSMFD